MITKLKRLGMELWVQTLKRVPFMLGILVVIGIVAGVQSYRKTSQAAQSASQAAQSAKESSEATAKNTETIKNNQIESNRKRDEQTLLLCRIILAGNLPLNDNQSQQVEDICREAIRRSTSSEGSANNQRSSASAATPESSPTSSSSDGTPGGTIAQPNNPQTPAQPNDSRPPLLVVPQPNLPCLTIGNLPVCVR